ncbi:sodium/hydrogen exchanger 9B2-like [Parasteatoda tepidariorum]|uniref:sodium/hydrogen exchanger 9B2-like n=1 Tax=Parasteatoda tepidariorum TaxID=114398 RepID=UPI001C71E24C|nr:sodium/hydrogen exchanger 9B2-like [Parasteatoda tepidariorum]
MSVEADDLEEISKKEHLQKAFSTCPPMAPFSTVCALILLAGFVYGTLWGLLETETLPGGPVFGLYILGIFCYLGGQFMRLLKVPTLVGMMVSGFILRNVPHINVAKDIPEIWADNIRNLALIFVLLRAGLEVDSDIIRNNKITCAKIILIPFISEFIVGSVVAHFLLKMNWMWSFLLGAMLSAVSPAVVLPVMLKMMRKGLGMVKGIPTMVISVAGVVDVLSLTTFEVLFGIILGTGGLVWEVCQGPVEMFSGIAYGIMLGMVCWFIPNPDEKSRAVFRVLMLVFGSTCIFFGSQALNAGSAGALGCILLPFTAAIRWKRMNWEEHHNPVNEALAFIWRIIEPFLFGLIGSEIRIDYLEPQTIGLALATIFSALAARIVSSMLSACSSDMTIKEQIFITFAGFPKATVQAAIGPTPLAMARRLKLGPEFVEYGIVILTVAVLAIFILAPLGATAISLLAPRLLEADASNKLDEQLDIDNKDSSNITMYETLHVTNKSKHEMKMPTIKEETLDSSKL